MWRMLLQQNFLELRQLCFHEVLIWWFSTWVAHWETTKVVSGGACRKLPGFSKHVFFKARERSCPKPIKNRGKGHDNVCLLFLISADCVIYVIYHIYVNPIWCLWQCQLRFFFTDSRPKRQGTDMIQHRFTKHGAEVQKFTASKVETSCWPHIMDQGIGHGLPETCQAATASWIRSYCCGR